MATMMLFNDSMIVLNQSWFIPMDILTIVSTIFTIILAGSALCIIIFDKTCHTIPMLLVANSCLTELVFGCVMFGMALFTLQNDLQQIYFYDSLCIFRGYMSFLSVGVQNYSYLLQGIYRYAITVYPNRLFYKSVRFQSFLVCLIWICWIIYPIPIVFTNQFKYHVDSQTCQMPLQLSFLTIFNALYIYFIPMGAMVLIYIRMVRYVQEMSARVTLANTLIRIQRELKMIRRIIIVVSILVALGFPYAIFILMSFFNSAPQYHFRIAFIFGDISMALVMVVLFQFNDPLKTFVRKIISRRRLMRIQPIIK